MQKSITIDNTLNLVIDNKRGRLFSRNTQQYRI